MSVKIKKRTTRAVLKKLRLRWVVTMALTMGLGWMLASGCSAKPPRAFSEVDWSNLRVGVYNTRAVALAWERSKQHNAEIDAKMAQCKKAEGASDTKRVKELKAWGKARQKRLHYQVFSDAPIGDIMARLKERLPEIARKAGVNVIVAKGRYRGPDEELVDVK